MKEIFITQPEIKESLDRRPYVVSGDIKNLLQQWGKKNGFVLPDDNFFNELRSDFGLFMTQVFPGFELITEEELTNGLNILVKEDGNYPLSLDMVYYPSNPRVDITRQIDLDGSDKGLSRRAGSPLLLKQFRNFKNSGVKEICLVDDVIFSGEVLVRVIEALNRIGIQTKSVYAGIGIKEGVDLLKNKGYQVKCIRTYDEVIDEICERDFYPGVPLSGRLIDSQNNIGAPYLLPFGNPGKWASIPEEWQKPVSEFCIGQTIKLFRSIELASNKKISMQDLGRQIKGLPSEGNFVDILSQLKI
jgi:hypothetical protein